MPFLKSVVVGFHQNNANFGREELPHFSYRPDLAPSDFYLLSSLKEFLPRTNISSVGEVKSTEGRWLKILFEDFDVEGIQNMVFG